MALLIRQKCHPSYSVPETKQLRVMRILCRDWDLNYARVWGWGGGCNSVHPLNLAATVKLILDYLLINHTPLTINDTPQIHL